MNLTRVGIVMVSLFLVLSSPIRADEKNSCASTGEKGKIFEGIKSGVDEGMTFCGIKEISKLFWGKIKKSDAQLSAASPLAQPGSYSLTPPRSQPDKESIRGLLRETCGNKDKK